MSSFQLERFGHIALLRIDRPPANAIDLELAKELSVVLEGIDNSTDVKALVVTGTGSCFSAGLDSKAIPTRRQGYVSRLERHFQHLAYHSRE